MSIMGELNHFLGLQIKQLKDDIFTNQSKYISDMLKKYGMEGVKLAATPISTTIKLTKDEKGKEVDEKLVSVSPNPNTLYPDFIFDIYYEALFYHFIISVHV